MSKDLIAEFLDSMPMDFDKWHDGIGYDIALIDEMTSDQRVEVERHLVQKGVTDWRDLEALDRLGTPGALDAILAVRQSGPEELALRAHQYGPPSSGDEKEEAILRGLDSDGGRSEAIDKAAENPSPKVIAKLFECARDCGGTEGYKSALALYFIHKKVDSMYSWDHRAFFLKFVDPGPEKDAAVQKLRTQLRLTNDA